MFERSNKQLPRILLLADKRGWAFDCCARNLSHHLRDRFTFDLKYVREQPRLDLSRYDLLYVYFWGEDYYHRFPRHGVRLVKEVSSHRWQDDPRYGPLTPAVFSAKYLSDASSVICTSRRLFDLLEGVRPELHLACNGYEECIFHDKGRRCGELVIGWAGNRTDRVKRVAELLKPATVGFQLATADGKRPRWMMNSFYNSIDVYTVASLHEGTPLPLLEAMAAGCFPVCTDVGVVPEIIRHGENGLIVESSVEAFRDSFEWCYHNLSLVRQKGSENAVEIRSVRSWDACARRFGDILDHVLTL